MGEKKYIKKLLEISRNFDIAKYKETDFREIYVPYTGTPKKHPTDSKRVLITDDPFSKSKTVYEFPLSSIIHVEEMETITSEEGESAPILRFWIKKGTPGIKHEPFLV